MDPNLNQLGMGGLTVCVTTFLIGIFVLIKNRKIFFNQIWFLFCSSVSIFGLGFYNVDTSTDSPTALFWWKYMYIGVSFIAVTFLHFNFEVIKFPHSKRKILCFLYPSFIFFLFLNLLSPLFFKSVTWKFGNVWYADGGKFFIFFFILWWGTAGYALFIVLVEYLKTNGKLHKQTGYWLLAFTVGLFGGIFCYLPIFNINYFYPYTIYLIAVWTAILFVGIVKTKLWEIDTVAHKTLLWIATSLWLIIPGYGMISFILPWLKTLPVLWFTVVELILFYLFLNYYLIFQPKIDHLFRRRKYDYQTVLGKIAEKIATCINVEQLTEQLLTEICQTMYLRNSLFYLLSREEQKYTLIGKRGSQTENEPANGAEFSISGNLLCTWLNEHHDILDKELIETEQYFEARKNELLSWFEKQNLELLVPIIFEQKIIGLLGLGKKENLQHYTLKDKELLKKLGEETGVTLFNALHYKDILEKDRLEEEVKMGQQIQMNLLPQEMPHIPGLEIVGYIHPAKEIGGDYYDFISRPHNNEFGFVIGDVSGKGVAAGIVMSMVKMAINTLSQQMFSPREILCSTNASLFNQVKGEKFITLLYFLWQPRTQQLAYSSAGHEHILFYHSKEQRIEAIVSGGIMLGMLPDVSEMINESNLSLCQGDKILLYTDGVTEARNPQNELFTLERLTSLFTKYRSLAPNQLIENISKDIFSYMEGSPQYDDITLIAVEAKNILTTHIV